MVLAEEALEGGHGGHLAKYDSSNKIQSSGYLEDLF